VTPRMLRSPNRQQRDNRRLRRLVLSTALLSALGLSGYWTFVFFNTFNVFGLPVRDDSHGWLGPTPWAEEATPTCVVDIGKVNYWRCSDVTVFRRHRLGCALWVLLNGFRPSA
jgi:hypothetical protein